MEDQQSVTVTDIFKHLYSRSGSGDADIKKLLALLSATTEAVKAAPVKASDGLASHESPIAFFGALMTALERSGAEHAKEIFYLLSLLIPHVSPALIRAKSALVCGVFSAALGSPAVNKNEPALRSLLSCAGDALAALDIDAATWVRDDISKLSSAVLSHTVSPRPKVRRSAQKAVEAMVTAAYVGRVRAEKERAADELSPTDVGCAAIVSSFYARILAAPSQADQSRLEQVMPLIRQTLPFLPSQQLVPIVQAMLKVPTMAHPRLSVAAYSSLAELLESPRSRLPQKFVQKCVESLVSARPSPDDHATTAEYCYTMAAALTMLASTERIKAGASPEVSLDFSRAARSDADTTGCVRLPATHAVLPSALTAMMQAFTTDRIAVQHSTANAIATVLATCVDALAVQDAVQALASGRKADDEGAPAVLRLVAVMAKLLNFQYQPSWPISLPVIAVFLSLLGPSSASLAAGLLRSLVNLQDAIAKAADAAAVARADREDAEDEEEEARRRRAKRSRRWDNDDAGSDAGDDPTESGERGDGSADAAASAIRVERTLLRIVAAAIRSAGMHGFVQAVGLTRGQVEALPDANAAGTSSVPAGCIHEGRAWLLPLLRDNGPLTPTPLAFWHTVLFPAIQAETAASSAAAAAKKGGLAQVHGARTRQLWALLPPIMVAAPDFASQATGFNTAMGKVICAALTDSGKPEIATMAARALETAIVRLGTAAGLPVVDIYAKDVEDAGERGEGDGKAGIGQDDEQGLTILGGGKKGKKGKHGRKGKHSGGDEDEEEDYLSEDEDEEDEDDGVAGSVQGSRAGGDGATVIFGAGGVSVYAGGSENDPRHALIVSALRATSITGVRTLPYISLAQATAGLEVLKTFAKNYLPVLFNAYEIAAHGGGAAPAAGTAAASAVPAKATAQLSEQVSSERARKVLDATAAYLSLAPPDLLTSLSDRLLAMLSGSIKALSASQEAERAARSAHTAAETAASKGAAGTATSVTAAALKAAKATLKTASTRTCSLLSLTLAAIPAFPAVPAPPAATPASTGKKGKGGKGAKEAAAPAPVQEHTVDRIYSAVGPLLSDSSDAAAHAQKRAYAVLGSILAHHPHWVRYEGRGEALLQALAGSLQAVSATARRARLYCLKPLFRAVDLTAPAIRACLPLILGDIIACVKDGNARVRTCAHEALIAMGHAMLDAGGEGGGADELGATAMGDNDEEDAMDDDDDEDEEDMEEDGAGAEYLDEEDAAMAKAAKAKGKKKASKASSASAAAPPTPAAVDGMPDTALSLTEFFRMVLAGLGAGTPHMRSATILALARLIYEFGSTDAVASLAGPLLDTVLMLLKEQARETVTAVVSFAKVVASSLPPEELKQHTPRLLTALLVWSGERKERIKMKIRAVLERLVRRLGYDAVAPHIPATDEALLKHIKKMADRRARQKATRSALQAAGAQGGVLHAAAGSGASVATTRTTRTAFDELLDYQDGGDDDEEADDMHGDASTAYTGRGAGGASVVSTGTARWAGTVTVPMGIRPDRPVGGPGSRMTAVTQRMRESSAILADAAASLPPLGTISDPTGLAKGKMRATAAKTVISKLTGLPVPVLAGASGAQSVRTSATNKDKEARPSNRAAMPTALLRSDDMDGDGMPLDLLDERAMQSVVTAGSAAAAAAIDAKRRAAATASAEALSGNTLRGLRVGADGRLIIPADALLTTAQQRKAGAASKTARKEGQNDMDEDDMEEGGSRKAPRRERAGQPNVEDGGDSDGEGGEEESEEEGRQGAKGRSVVTGNASRVQTLSKPGSGLRVHGSSSSTSIPSSAQGWGQKRGKDGKSAQRAAADMAGSRFASKKSGTGGDIQRKGSKLEPFVYVPLDARAMSGGGGSLAVSRFSGVMGGHGAHGDRLPAGGRGSARDSSQMGGKKRKRS